MHTRPLRFGPGRRAGLTLALCLLTACGGSTPDVGALTRQLRSTQPQRRQAAAEALARQGSRGAPAVEALNKAVLDPELSVRRAVVAALTAVGPAGRRGLTVALNDAEAEIRRAAARAVGALGPGASKSVPNLVDTLSDKDEAVATAARGALVSIGADAIPALLRELGTGKDAAQQHATVALVALGPPTLPGLALALKSPRVDVRRTALSAIASVLESHGPPKTSRATLITALRRLHDDEDPAIAAAASAVTRQLD